jgi:hypothetical protein
MTIRNISGTLRKYFSMTLSRPEGIVNHQKAFALAEMISEPAIGAVTRAPGATTAARQSNDQHRPPIRPHGHGGLPAPLVMALMLA